MLLSLVLDIKPVSVNNRLTYNPKSRRMVLDPKYRSCKHKIEKELIKYEEEIASFVAGFDPKEFIAVTMSFGIPTKKLITKKGLISKVSGDIDNMPKAILDVLFKKMGLDDSLVCRLELEKLPVEQDDYCVIVTVQNRDLELLI